MSRWPLRFHGVMTVAWTLAIPLTILTSLKTSLLWIGFMSCYANAATEFGAYQAARTERAVDDARV
jgi:hypothetical protein